jgi:hypothetical protein
VYAFVVPTLPRSPYLNWADYQADPFDPNTLEPNPFAEAFYAELPSGLSDTAGFNALKTNLIDWLVQNAYLSVYYNPVLKMYSAIGEDYRDFMVKVQAVARQQRDEEIDKVAARYDKQLATLESRVQYKASRLRSEKDELEARKREELISAGESMFSLFKGRANYALSRTSRLRRYTTTSQDQVGIMEGQMMDLTTQIEATQREMEDSLQAVQEKWVQAAQQIEQVTITPYKKDIYPTLFGLGWVPYWDVVINNQSVILAASTSGLSQAQG